MRSPGELAGDDRRHGSRWAVLAFSALLFTASQFWRVANAVVASDHQRDLHLSAEALGGISAAFFYGFAAAQVPLALVLDRVGARWTMTVLTLVGAGGAIVFANADGIAGATLGRVLLGVGMAGNLMGSLQLVAQWFSPREFATLAGVLATLGTLGNILATTPLALLVGAIGWRRAFVLVAAATTVAAIAFWTVVRDRQRDPGPATGGDPPPSTLSMARDLLRSGDYWLISFGAFCRYGAFLAIQGLWAGPYLVTVAGLSPVSAASFILLMNVGIVVGGPIGGWLSDRALRSRKQVMMISLAGIGGAQAVLAVAPERASVWIVGSVMLLLGISSSFGQVVYAHVKDLLPRRMTGMAMTGVNFFVMLGAGTFLHGIGWIVDHWSDGAHASTGYRAGFALGAAATGLALALYARTRDAHVEHGSAG